MDVFDYLSGVSPPRYKKPTSGDAKCIWEQIGFEESDHRNSKSGRDTVGCQS